MRSEPKNGMARIEVLYATHALLYLLLYYQGFFLKKSLIKIEIKKCMRIVKIQCATENIYKVLYV